MSFKDKIFIKNLRLEGMRVLVRVDFNVPLRNGVVENDKRLTAALPTIIHLQEQGAKTILVSHLGRPKGQVNDEMRLGPVAERLGKILYKEVKYCDEVVGEKAVQATKDLKNGEAILMENVRFHAEEEKNDEAFSKQLAELCDGIYVNDAFGTAHRAHASTAGVTKFVDTAACGFLLKMELDYLTKALTAPDHPFVGIIGGAKVSSKIGVIEAMLEKVDHLLLGGAMTFTFLKAKGLEVGKSLAEDDYVDLAKELMEKGAGKILLPQDVLVSDTFDFKNRSVGALNSVGIDAIPTDTFGLDIGEKTLARFKDVIGKARTVVWNGPMGVFEIEATAQGTLQLAHAIADVTDAGAMTIVGGGESVTAVEKAGLEMRVSHVSTGGGAALKFLEGKDLPGVAALSQA